MFRLRLPTLLALAAVLLLAGCGGGAPAATDQPDTTEQTFQPLTEAETAFYTGRDAEGLALVNEALEANPDNPQANALHAGFALREGDLEAANQWANQALELEPQSAFALAVQSWLLAFDTGDFGAAQVKIDEAFAIEPNQPLALSVQSSIAFEQQDNETALSLTARLIEVRPDYVASYQNRAGHYLGEGEYELALENFNKALEINPDLINSLDGRAEVNIELGNLEAALADINRLIELQPDVLGFYADRAFVYLSQENNDAALADLNYAVEQAPDVPYSYWDRGYAYEILGDLDTAIADYTTAVDLGLPQEDPYIYSYRGAAYYRNGNTEASIADLRMWLAIDPENPDPHNELAYILALSDGDLGEAQELITFALEQSPADLDYQDTQAYVLYKRGNLEAAGNIFQQLVDEGYTFGYYGLGLVQEANGDTEAAIQSYQTFLEEATLTAPEADARQRLEALTG